MIVFTVHHLMIMSISTFYIMLEMLHLTFRTNWYSLFPEEFVFFIEFTKLTLAVWWRAILVLELIGVLMMATVFVKELSELSMVIFVILTIRYMWLWVPWWINKSWWSFRTSSLSSWAFKWTLVVTKLLLIEVMLLSKGWIVNKGLRLAHGIILLHHF